MTNRRLVPLSCFFLFALSCCSPKPSPAEPTREHENECTGDEEARRATDPRLFEGIGATSHQIRTRSAEAQRFFDQGLSFVYAFNHDEALRSFQRASEIDPGAAMPYWGQALSLGPNINLDVDPDHERAAYAAIQKARALESDASPAERQYIEALALRYSDDPKADLKALAVSYHDAMRRLANALPDDLDAAVLFAESGMDLHPWALWSADGLPVEGTEEIVSTLEHVLAKNPCHVGANHYYIHAVEASPHPERALAAARRLPALAPNAGHLVHMPAHVLMRVGDYAGAAESNRRAIRADDSYFARLQAAGVKPEGAYPAMYYNHNLHFLAIASAMHGDYEEASRSAALVAEHAGDLAPQMPMLDSFVASPILLRVLFGRWDELLAEKAPPQSLPVTSAVWHFGRGMGFAARHATRKARAELTALQDARRKLPADLPFGATTNMSVDVLRIPELQLEASIEGESGREKNAETLLRQAAELEDALRYDEPEDWYISSRLQLAERLLRSADAGHAAAAERLCRDELVRRPRSGRAFLGLARALRALHREDEARAAEEEFRRSWVSGEQSSVAFR